MKKLTVLVLAMTMLILNITTAFGIDSSLYTIEDVYYYFGEYRTTNEEMDNGNVTVLSELPNWSIIRDEYMKCEDSIELTGKEYSFIRERRNIAKCIVIGFEKASKWDKFKRKLESIAVYNSELRELAPKTENVDTLDEFQEVSKSFSRAMGVASTWALFKDNKAMTEKIKNTGIGKNIHRIVDSGLGLIGVLIYEIGRALLALGNINIICEIAYISYPLLRPFLGKEGRPFKRKQKNSDNTVESQDDYSMVPCLVTRQTKNIVHQEYQIKDMDTVVQHSLFATWVVSKIPWIIGVGIGVLCCAGNIWGTLIATASGVVSLFF